MRQFFCNQPRFEVDKLGAVGGGFFSGLGVGGVVLL